MSKSYDPLNNYGTQDIVYPSSQGPLLPRQVIGLRAQSAFGTSILQRVYPIGCIYASTTTTNPGDRSVLGFGTWEALAPGQVLVGLAPSGTFSTIGGTGGAETHNVPLTGYSVTETSESGRIGGTVTGVDGKDEGITSDMTVNTVPPYRVVSYWTRTA